MKFKSKSETLKNLRLKKSIIPELIIFKCRDYLNNEKKIIFKISKKFKPFILSLISLTSVIAISSIFFLSVSIYSLYID